MATVSSVLLKDAEGQPWSAAAIDLSDVGSGPFVRLSALMDRDGNPISKDNALTTGLNQNQFTSLFARASTATAYASGDVITSSDTASFPSGVPYVLFPLSEGKGIRIMRVRLSKSIAAGANPTFRVHLFTTEPTGIPNDNAALALTTGAFAYLGATGDIVMSTLFADGGIGFGVPAIGSDFRHRFPYGAEARLYWLLEARAAYAPNSGETFTLTVEATLD